MKTLKIKTKKKQKVSTFVSETIQQTASTNALYCYQGQTYSSAGVLTFTNNPTPALCPNTPGGFCTV